MVPPGRSPEGTYYATLIDGKWRSERITKAIGASSFALDTETGAVQVLVNASNPHEDHDGPLTHYERAPGGGWTATPLQASVDSGALIRIDEADGTLVVVYQDGRIIRAITRR